VLATYAVALFITAQFGITRFDNWLLAEYRPPLWTFATFTQSIPIAFGGYGGPRWMAMTWSLAIEEQFYLLFPLAVYLLPRRGLVAVVVAGLVAAPIFRDVLERVFGYWYAPYVLLPSRMDALMYGVAVALIVRSEYAFAVAKRFRRALDVIALVILWSIIDNWDLTLWPASTSFALFHSTFGIMGAIVILRVFTYEKSTFNAIWRNSILAKIGLISYALYMYHQAVNGLVHGLLFNQEPTISEPAHLVAAIGVIAIATVLAALSYRYFERPIRQYGAALAARVSSTEAAPRALIPSKADRLT
jgi:peptidoglycan/LPS O-acetylase OafA/YrhL